MPNHLLHSDGGQAIALLVLIVSGICVRYWRITLAIAAALLIGTALVALSVITDLHIAHQFSMYLRDLGRAVG
jgi:galactitol-specific phosphotransferase system IIC component